MRTMQTTLFALALACCQGGGGSGEPETAPTQPEAASPGTAAAAAPASATPVGPEGGPAVSNQNYLIEVVPQGATTTNQEGQVDIRLVARNGYHVSPEYPIKLAVQAPPDVTLARNEYDRAAAAEFGDPRAVFAVRFTPTAPGEKQISADFRFSLCNDQSCLLERKQLSWTVRAQ